MRWGVVVSRDWPTVLGDLVGLLRAELATRDEEAQALRGQRAALRHELAEALLEVERLRSTLRARDELIADLFGEVQPRGNRVVAAESVGEC
jgi:chromosome segregation ATPase